MEKDAALASVPEAIAQSTAANFKMYRCCFIVLMPGYVLQAAPEKRRGSIRVDAGARHRHVGTGRGHTVPIDNQDN